MTYYFYLITSFIGDIYITFKNNLIWSLHDLWRPIIIFPLLFTMCVIIHAIVISFISLFADRRKKWNNPDNFFRTVTLETIDLFLHIMRARIHVSGEELLPEDKRFLLIGNHRSIFDPMIAMLKFQDKELAFVSKKENIEIPFGGRLMLASGCIPLDRDNNRSAIKSIRAAVSRINEGSYSMGIYPEGGINKTDDELRPFHSGSFKIAKKTHSPIVVTVVRNTEQLKRRFLYTPTNVYFDVIRVINPDEYDSMSTGDISRMVYNEMHNYLRKKRIEQTANRTEGREAAC